MNDKVTATPLLGKTALVTGAGKGIGKACALAFARAGANTVLVSRTLSEIQNTAAEIESLAKANHLSISATAFRCDISVEKDVESLFKQLSSKHPSVDFLVNNAAIFLSKPAQDQSLEEWNRVMQVNANGTFLCCREFFRLHAKKPSAAAIVNISSLAGVRGTEKFPGLSSYVASKFAVVGLTESLAVEGRSLGIRVNCIAPGAVDTEMLRQAVPTLKPKAKPEDIANLVLFLCDENQSRAISGSTLEIYSNA